MARLFAERSWPQKFRTYKSSLRVVLKNGNATEVLPKGVDPHIWRKFVENEGNPKKEQVARNLNKQKKINLSIKTYKQSKMFFTYLLLTFSNAVPSLCL